MMNKELKKLDKKITKNKLSAEAKQKQKADKMAILNPQKVNIFNIW
ncbi:Uncharacterised protein, partial [Metamycoplasma alkalescens]